MMVGSWRVNGPWVISNSVFKAELSVDGPTTN